MLLEIAVVDDVEMDRTALKNNIESWFREDASDMEVSCSCFPGGEELLRSGGLAGRFTIVFLDICLKGQNGLETAARLRRANPEILIIFVSTEKEYALDAYSVHPFDFLVKPFTRERLGRVIEDAVRILWKQEAEVEIRVPYGTTKVLVRQIVSVVSRGHAVEYQLANGNLISSIFSFAEAMRLLEAYPCFLLVNRGVAINMDQATGLHDGRVVMETGDSFPLRIRDRAELERQFTQYQIKHRMGT